MQDAVTHQTHQNPVEGNTNPPPLSKDKRARRWCFTLNNWTEEDLEKIVTHITHVKGEYIIGKEVAPDTGTPHLQGALCYKSAIAFSSLKNVMPRAHIEPQRGTRKQNIQYCGKSGVFVTNIVEKVDMVAQLRKEALDEFTGVIWKPWQQEVLDMLKTKPDSRTIHWYWEHNGNTGKSFLCKYIDLMEDAIIAQGKTADILNQLLEHVKAGKRPNVIILDIPREKLEYTIYSTLEMLKNGHVYSGKYEGGKLIFPHPHVFVFANAPPLDGKLSADRCRVIEIANPI